MLSLRLAAGLTLAVVMRSFRDRPPPKPRPAPSSASSATPTAPSSPARRFAPLNDDTGATQRHRQRRAGALRAARPARSAATR